jgi:hypothetical protein
MDPQALLAEIPMYPACKRMFLLQKKIQKKKKKKHHLETSKKRLVNESGPFTTQGLYTDIPNIQVHLNLA